MFSVHTTPEEFKTQQVITDNFRFVVEGNSGRGISGLSCCHRFRKSFVFKLFPVSTKTRSRRFQIPSVWRTFSKSSGFETISFPYCAPLVKGNEDAGYESDHEDRLLVTTAYVVQSQNSPFFPPHIGAEPGRAKEESRITCMRMLRTNQSKITRPQPRCSRQCVAQCLSQLTRWKKTFSLTLILS